MPHSSHQTEDGLAHVRLLKRRATHFRLDWSPFALVYGIGLGDSAKYLLEGRKYRTCLPDDPKVESNARDVLRDAALWIAAQLGIVALLHVLLVLFCYWSVRVKAFVGYVKAKNIHEANAVMVCPDTYPICRECSNRFFRRD